MLVLSLKTDQPEAELAIYDGSSLVAEEKWLADRRLAETIHLRLKRLLERAGLKLDDIEGLVIFKGPGSFTGLRIGFSVANALSYSLGVKIAATGGANWRQQGLNELAKGSGQEVAVPDYGQPPKVTEPRK